VRKADDPRVVRARNRGSCGQPGASFFSGRSLEFVLRPPGRLYARRRHDPLPRTPSPNGVGAHLRSGLWKPPPLTRAWTRLRSHPRMGARPHPLGKRCAFPTGAWTRFARPPLPQAPPPRLHLSCLDEGAQGYFRRWLDRRRQESDKGGLSALARQTLRRTPGRPWEPAPHRLTTNLHGTVDSRSRRTDLVAREPRWRDGQGRRSAHGTGSPASTENAWAPAAPHRRARARVPEGACGWPEAAAKRPGRGIGGGCICTRGCF